jgi:hypothetical protein
MKDALKHEGKGEMFEYRYERARKKAYRMAKKSGYHA